MEHFKPQESSLLLSSHGRGNPEQGFCMSNKCVPSWDITLYMGFLLNKQKRYWRTHRRSRRRIPRRTLQSWFRCGRSTRPPCSRCRSWCRRHKRCLETCQIYRIKKIVVTCTPDFFYDTVCSNSIMCEGAHVTIWKTLTEIREHANNRCYFRSLKTKRNTVRT